MPPWSGSPARSTGVELDPARLLATEEEFAAADRALEPEVKEAIRYAVDNIRRFHERQKPEPMWLMEIRPGAFAGERWTPIPSVACYVPRGKGAFPSVMMMTTVPAVVAGVPEIVVLTPATPEGGIDAASLFAARTAGVAKVYRVGGAVAVAAAAFGTASVPKAAKIVGPGSPWVVAAKRLRRRPDRHRPAGRPQRVDRARRRDRQPGHRRPRPADRGRARPRQLGLPGHRQPRDRRAAPAPACRS